MKKSPCILIADRNPHVREFFKRELTAEGYQIKTAGSCPEVVHTAYADNLVDVIILDPDLPGNTDSNLLKTLRSRVPAVPVIVHAFSQEAKLGDPPAGNEIFVEKEANSIEQIKKIVHGILARCKVS